MIGDDVIFTVLGIKGNQVRWGIVAPERVAVHRKEVYERINPDRVIQEEQGSSPTFARKICGSSAL